MTLVSFVYCLVLVTTLISQVSANDEVLYTQNYSRLCNDRAGNYKHNFSYGKNLNTLLSMLTNNTEIDYGFYNFTYGDNSDKVYAIALCRGDVNPDECRKCLVISAAKLAELCPMQKEAIGWYEDEKCMLRYSNRSIFNLMEIGPAFYAHSMENATDLEQFNKSLSTLLSNLKSQAASGNSLFKYAVGNISAPDNKVIYGLAQCTPDLLGPQCDQCLAKSIERILIICKDRIGGRIFRPSCNLRFETSFPFYGPTAYPPPQPPGKNYTAIIVIAKAISVAASVVFIYICICPGRKQWEKFETQQEEYGGEIDISESLQFSFNTIRDATNDFSDSKKLGQGGFGTVYRGRLSNGQDIAVKRLSTNSGQGDKEFKNEVNLVAKLQHRNLVRLLGFCLEGRERLLVYEFVPNKSLDYFIFHQTKREQLDWQMRYKIIASIARGILYLHQDSRLLIIHRDLKLSNILLDEEMNPKISDFGLARLFVENQTHGDTNRVVGTYGYMAPEYAMRGQFSQKSDVFSFGVLILEIVSGQKNSGTRHGENKEDLLTFAWRNWTEGTATNIEDPTLNNGSQDEIMRCIHIGLLCVQEKVADRPTMASVVLMLNNDVSLPLPVPLEPPLYVDNRTGNVPDMQLWEFNSGTRSSEHSTRSAQESINEVSITDPYPR